jgi:hypothetical protein
MKMSHSIETAISAAINNSLAFWDSKFCFCVQRSLPLAPYLGQMNAVVATLSYFSKFHLNIINQPKS